MNSIQKRIEDLKENGFALSFSETLNEAFRIWQKIFAYGALALLIYMIFYWIVNLSFSFLPFMSEASANLESAMQKMAESGSFDGDKIIESYKEFYSDPKIIGVSIFSQFIMALMFPILAGIVYLAYKFDTTGEANVSYIFEGFNGNRFGRLIVLFLLYKLASIVGALILGIGFFIPLVGFSIASSFVMINDMKTMDAIKASFSLTFKHFFTVLFLIILSYFVGGLGLFACGIGVLFTYPLIPVMTYAIYKKSVGVYDDSELDEIGVQ